MTENLAGLHPTVLKMSEFIRNELEYYLKRCRSKVIKVHTSFSLLLIVKCEYQYQFSRSVMSDSLRPHGPQHTRPRCPSPTPGVHPNPCPSSWWFHPTISYSVVPISSCPQSFPALGSFPVSQFFQSGGQSIGVSAWASVLPWIFRTYFL